MFLTTMHNVPMINGVPLISARKPVLPSDPQPHAKARPSPESASEWICDAEDETITDALR